MNDDIISYITYGGTNNKKRRIILLQAFKQWLDDLSETFDIHSSNTMLFLWYLPYAALEHFRLMCLIYYDLIKINILNSDTERVG